MLAALKVPVSNVTWDMTGPATPPVFSAMLTVPAVTFAVWPARSNWFVPPPELYVEAVALPRVMFALLAPRWSRRWLPHRSCLRTGRRRRPCQCRC